MKIKHVYALMCKDMDEVEVVMIFDEIENARSYKKQLEEENDGCEFEYYIEDTKAMIIK